MSSAVSKELGFLLCDPSRRHWWDGSTWRRISGPLNGAEFLVRTPSDPIKHLLDGKAAVQAVKEWSQRGVNVLAVRVKYLCQ